MFREIQQLPNNLGVNALGGDEDILGTLLGRNIDGYTIEHMEMLWLISSIFINSMYRKNAKEKRVKAKLSAYIPLARSLWY